MTLRGPRINPGSVGEYYEGPLFQGRCKTVYAATCSHCRHIMEFESRRKMDVDVCRGCMRIICPGCVGKSCVPNEMWCEQVEREERIKRRVEQGAWGCY